MELLVIFFWSALVFYIVLYGVFITITANRADEVPLGPKLSAPQLLLDCGYSLEYFSGRYAFHYFH